MDATSQTLKDGNQVERIKLDNSNVTINGAYTLPTTAGIEGDVLTKSAGSAAIWKDPSNKGIYSQIAPVTNANTTTETTMNGFGAGNLTIPANTVVLGSSFRYSTGGTFRDNANNTTFRFRLRTAVVLFDSNILTLPNITAITAWTLTTISTYVAVNTMITNFAFTWNTGNLRNGFTVQGSGTFDHNTKYI
jgi:hypothetical protein